MEIYRVKSGDSLWRISRRFGVPMQSIIDVNGLTQPENLIVGMELVIPIQPTQSIISYMVMPGDSLWSIGQKFNVDYRQIAQLNNLISPFSLFIGQRLRILINTVRYTVKSGDSLWLISRRYDIPISQIATLNNLQPPYVIYPGQVLVIYNGNQQKTPIETLGYYNPSFSPSDTSIIDNLGEYLTYLGVFDFPVTASGEILGTLDSNVLRAAQDKGVTLLPVLTNLKLGSFDSELARSILSDATNLNNLINNTLTLLNEYDLKGILIDFENLYPEDRSLFTNFISRLSEALHNNNKILAVNLAPKWEDWPDLDWVGFFDYNAIGPDIDIAAIMTYEWGWREGPPRPTAPVDFVRRALDYAIQNNVPANKILMGMTLYGYDWSLPDTPENLATTVTLPRVWDLARTYNSRIYFDEEPKQPYMDYIDFNRVEHRVWFENALSHLYKYEIVKDYGLRGVFYWILNQPFQATWYLVSNLFEIKKL